MAAPRARKTFGEENIDAIIADLAAAIGSKANDDLIRSLIVTALDMDSSDLDRLELKIAAQTLAEMLNSWKVFSPYKQQAKVTIFGSARTKPEHPDYKLCVEFGRLMGERNWMAITGAGPGIMTAGFEGIGIEKSMGVSIVLPFEEKAAPFIEGDDKLATFRYFFTRKLAFMKETDAFALFPGGFGTLDEAFELLTLIQTGKCYPAPIVLLDHPGSTYWSGLSTFIEQELNAGGLISPSDTSLYLHTHDPAEAVEHLCSFYSCYHSLRYVRDRLILRLRHAPSAATIATLNEEFAGIIVSGAIEATEASKVEKKDDDNVELPRLAFKFDNRSFAELMQLIQRLNTLEGTTGAKAATGLLHDVEPELDADAPL